eukprot:COSAG01_NODE_72558_length_252_cov_1.751634_1_plen_61_part_01
MSVEREAAVSVERGAVASVERGAAASVEREMRLFVSVEGAWGVGRGVRAACGRACVLSARS